MIWFRDVAERAAATWVETFCGLLIASGLDAPGIHLISVAERAAIAALPAALAIIKAAFASRVGPPSSASLDPAVAADPTPSPREVRLVAAMTAAAGSLLETAAKNNAGGGGNDRPSGPLGSITHPGAAATSAGDLLPGPTVASADPWLLPEPTRP